MSTAKTLRVILYLPNIIGVCVQSRLSGRGRIDHLARECSKERVQYRIRSLRMFLRSISMNRWADKLSIVENLHDGSQRAKVYPGTTYTTPFATAFGHSKAQRHDSGARASRHRIFSMAQCNFQHAAAHLEVLSKHIQCAANASAGALRSSSCSAKLEGWAWFVARWLIRRISENVCNRFVRMPLSKLALYAPRHLCR